MKKLFDPKIWVPERLDCKVARIVYILGGSKQPLIRKFARKHSTKVVVIDCEEELLRQKELHDWLGVIQFSLGTRESLATLTEGADYAIQEAVGQVATMLAWDGCGASPLAASLATERLVQSEHYSRGIDGVLDYTLHCTGGRLEIVEVLILGSYVGGVGAGAAIPIVRDMQERLAPLDIPVRFDVDVLGPVTFKGISENAGRNAAPTLGHLIMLATDQSNPAFKRMTVRVQLTELPPLGQDTESRNALLQLDEEAFRSKELQEYIARVSPNLALQGPLGTIHTREAGLFQPLRGTGEVVQSVATSLSRELEQMLKVVGSNPSLAGIVSWIPTTQLFARFPIEELLTRMNEFTVDEFIHAAKGTGSEVKYDLELATKKFGKIKVLGLAERLSEMPETMSDLVQRLDLLRDMDRLLDAKRWELLEERQHLGAEITAYEDRVRSLLHTLEEPHWFTRERTILSDLAACLSAMRQTHDAWLKQEAKCLTIAAALGDIEQERGYVERLISGLQNLLKRYLPAEPGNIRTPLVACKRFDDCLPEILSVVSKTETDQVEALCRCVTSVTLEGLARIVNAKEAKVSAIAEQIVFSRSVLSSPPHGGIMRADSVIKAYALPPVAEPFRDDLRISIAHHDSHAIVVFNDSTDFAFVGLTVIRYQIRGFDCIDELLVGTIKQDYLRAEQSPTSLMRYPTGTNPWPHLARFRKQRYRSSRFKGFDPSNN